MEIANIPPPPSSGLSEEQLDRLRELEEVTANQERGVAQLTNQVRVTCTCRIDIRHLKIRPFNLFPQWN